MVFLWNLHLLSYIRNQLPCCSDSPAPLMSIIYAHKAGVLWWVFEKWIRNIQEWQYPFGALCVWWISALVQLQRTLVYYIANRIFPAAKRTQTAPQNDSSDTWSISSTPTDVTGHHWNQGYSSVSLTSDTTESIPQNSKKLRKDNIIEPLRWTCKGKINMLLQTNALLGTLRHNKTKRRFNNRNFMKLRKGFTKSYRR